MKKLLALILALAMVLALAACGGTSTSSPASDDKSETADATESADTTEDADSEEDSETTPAADSVTLRFNLVKSTTDPQYEWYSRFWDDVNTATNGEVTGEVFTGESLGVTADVLEQAAQGEPVVADCDLAYLANYVPDMAAVMSPYLIQEPEQILTLWDSDVFQNMCAQLEEQGIHLIALNYEGNRNLVTVKPISSRADVSGLKIRCASTTMFNAVVETLGGNPTNIAMSEVYQALSQGVVDGAEGVFSVIYSNKWYEVCKNITLTEHLVGYTAIAMSSEVYHSLSAEAQDALDATAMDYMNEFLELSDGVQQEYRELLEAEGVTISEIDKSEFIEAANKVPESFPEWSDGILEQLQAVLYG